MVYIEIHSIQTQYGDLRKFIKLSEFQTFQAKRRTDLIFKLFPVILIGQKLWKLVRMKPKVSLDLNVPSPSTNRSYTIWYRLITCLKFVTYACLMSDERGAWQLFYGIYFFRI